MTEANRRTLLKTATIGGGVAGLGLVTWQVAGRREFITPTEAKARGAPLKVLTSGEAATLEAFGEILLPGATAAGIAAFVDHHLAIDPVQSLLTIRYLDLPPPYAPFYKDGLKALDAAAGGRFVDLDADGAAAFVKKIAFTIPPGWRGPPSPMLYFAIRSDAVDVVYGTKDGFEKLSIPYMAHIEPPRPW